MNRLLAHITVACPVRADGRSIRDGKDRIIAACPDTFVATALATLINLGEPISFAQELICEAAEQRLLHTLLNAKQPAPID